MERSSGVEIVLAHQGWRANDFIGTDAVRDVAAIAIDKLAQPQLTSDSADFFLDRFCFRRGKQRVRLGVGRIWDAPLEEGWLGTGALPD